VRMRDATGESVVGEAEIKRQLRQLQTQGRLEDGTDPRRWEARLALGQFQGLSAESLEGIDLYHSSYYAIPELARDHPRVRSVLTVHDIIPILHPEWCGMLGQGEVKRFHPEFNLPGALATLTPETWIICPSQATRDDLCNHCGGRIDPARVEVIPWAASGLFRPCDDPARLAGVRERYHLPAGEYLLSLSTLEPRKNLDRLIRAFLGLLQQERIGDLSLVLAGKPGWDYGPILQAARGTPELAQRIVFTGFVADADMAPLYSGALAFVYPSLYEGFGLPPLEAMQCGTPVIVSNTTSLPEVAGDAGLLVDPRDEAAIAQAMLDLYRSPTLRRTLAQQGLERAGGFSWGRCAEETAGLYRRAMGA
jgi:glycosyltransferase involved in cell wall biosynthesis